MPIRALVEQTWVPGAIAAAVGVVVGVWSLATGSDVPLLVFADLGFHELGHLIGYITRPPEWIIAIAGTGLQIAVPLGAAAVLFWWRRDPFGGSICLAWAATSMRNSSVYIADAPYERLTLIGGEHDWAYLLGEHWQALDRADDIARGLVRAGWVLLFVAGTITLLAIEHRLPDRRSGRGDADVDAAGVL
ncbi:MAG: hypothetical protein AAFZ07_02090 [Actinomycetota bacterium]